MNTRITRHPWRHVIGSVAGVGLVLLVGIVLLAARVSVFQVRQDTVDGQVVIVTADQPVRQTLTTHYPGLASVTLRLGEPLPPDDQVISLRLYDAASQPVVRLEVTGPLPDFREGHLVEFEFEPLDDSAGWQTVLVLSTEGEHPVPLQAHSLDMYLGGELDAGGDL